MSEPNLDQPKTIIRPSDSVKEIVHTRKPERQLRSARGFVEEAPVTFSDGREMSGVFKYVAHSRPMLQSKRGESLSSQEKYFYAWEWLSNNNFPVVGQMYLVEGTDEVMMEMVEGQALGKNQLIMLNRAKLYGNNSEHYQATLTSLRLYLEKMIENGGTRKDLIRQVNDKVVHANKLGVVLPADDPFELFIDDHGESKLVMLDLDFIEIFDQDSRDERSRIETNNKKAMEIFIEDMDDLVGMIYLDNQHLQMWYESTTPSQDIIDR